MLFVRSESFSELYVEVIQRVLQEGQLVAPRGLATVEVCPAHLVLENPRNRFLQVTERRINPAFAVAEAVWILSGSDASWIFTFNANLFQFTDNGVLKGAYGPRIRRWQANLDQLDTVRQLLIRQPETRQAVIQIFDPEIDYQGYRDVACTLNHRFLLRGGRLHMLTTMRSQDIWLGMPYDILTNTLLHELMAGWVGCEIGSYHHRVDSLHLYTRDLGSAKRVEVLDNLREEPPENFQVEWEEFDAILRNLVRGHDVENPSWQNFGLIMRSYRAWKNNDTRAAVQIAETVTGWLGAELRQWYSQHLRTPTENSL